jgi:hypothetical protein
MAECQLYGSRPIPVTIGRSSDAAYLNTSLTQLPARCYKRVFCSSACSWSLGYTLARKVFDAAKSALFLLLLCLAVEARSGTSVALSPRSKITRCDP